jgi:FkbM family methyltransferase
MIDVGAHHGSAFRPFLRRGWKVHAFEPDKINRGHLLENFPEAPNLDVVPQAVSDQAAEGVPFFASQQSTGISGLSAFHPSHTEVDTVETTTLTAYCRSANITSVEFLKIDTEGFDLMVLKGFPWETMKPDVVECEFEDSKTVPLGYDFHDLAKFLMAKGFVVYVSEWHPIVRYGIRHDWRRLARYPCELEDSRGWGNLLAFSRPPEEQRVVEEVKHMLNAGKPDSQLRQPGESSATAGPDDMTNRQKAVSVSASKLADYFRIFFGFYRTSPGFIVLAIVIVMMGVGPLVGDLTTNALVLEWVPPLARGFLLLFLIAYLVARIRHEIRVADQKPDMLSALSPLESSRLAVRIDSIESRLASDARMRAGESIESLQRAIQGMREQQQELQRSVLALGRKNLELRGAILKKELGESLSSSEETLSR